MRRFTLVAIWFVLLLSIVSTILQIRRTVHHYQPFGSDPVSVQDRTFQQIAPMIHDEKVIGYVDDRKLNMDTLKEYYLAQYSLAPRTLQGGYDYKVVVGIFKHSPPPPSLLNAHGLFVFKDCGNGIYILKKR